MKTTRRRLTAAWPLAILLLLPAVTRAETAVQAWVQRYNGPGNGWACPSAVAVDGNKDVIVTGSSPGSSGGYNYDYVTIKYSSAGVPLWTNLYNGPGNSSGQATAVAVDGSNNVIVTGFSGETGGDNDYATIKYSSAGVPLWTNRYDGSGNGDDEAQAVAVDSSNNVIVTGYSESSDAGFEYATIKYSSDGVPLWTNRYHGPGYGANEAYAVAVDACNNVIVTGNDFGSGNNLEEYATIEYSSDGVALWTNCYHGPGNGADWANAVAVDGNNNVIVTGCSAASAAFFDCDYATIKYSSAGVPLWTNRYNGPGNGTDWAWAVAVDGSNSAIVTGFSAGTEGGYDYATIKYSSAGVPLWTNRYNGPGNSDDEARAVAVDARNNVIVTGCSVGSGGAHDYATIKYSSAGVPLWINRYNGPGNGDDYATAVAVDHSGNVIVTGYLPGSGGGADFATIKYICVPEPVVTGLQMANGIFQMRVDDLLQPGTLVIEGSTDLANWSPVFTNTTPTNVLFYTDPDAGNYSGRFYRAFQFP